MIEINTSCDEVIWATWVKYSSHSFDAIWVATLPVILSLFWNFLNYIELQSNIFFLNETSKTKFLQSLHKFLINLSFFKIWLSLHWIIFHRPIFWYKFMALLSFIGTTVMKLLTIVSMKKCCHFSSTFQQLYF